MGFLEDILGQASSMPGDLGGMVGGIGQAMAPQAPRREKPGYRPMEEEKLAILQKYASMGLDPSAIMPLFQEITGGLDQRQDLYRQKNMMRKEAMNQLPGMASQAFEMSQAGMDPSAIGAAFGGVPGKAGNILENQIIGSFGGEGTTSGVPPEQLGPSIAKAQELAASGVPLHQARMQMVGTARMMGASESEIQGLYDLIGQAYNQTIPAGGGTKAGLINAPLTFAEYQQGPQVTPQPEDDERGGGLITAFRT